MAKRKGFGWLITLALVVAGFLGFAGYLLMVEGLAHTDGTPGNLITDALRKAHDDYPDLFVLLWGFTWGVGGLVVGVVIGHTFHRWGKVAQPWPTDIQPLPNELPAEYFAEEMIPAKKYNELLYAVGMKFPDETRHQTALRYIQGHERGSTYPGADSVESGPRK